MMRPDDEAIASGLISDQKTCSRAVVHTHDALLWRCERETDTRSCLTTRAVAFCKATKQKHKTKMHWQ